MSDALNLIDHSIESSSENKISFEYGINYSSRDSRGDDDIPKLNDQKVSINASNVALGTVIDNLCRESGWSYSFGGQILYFIDDDSHHFTARDAPSDWLGWNYRSH